jgi:hypothetical protein
MHSKAGGNGKRQTGVMEVDGDDARAQKSRRGVVAAQ